MSKVERFKEIIKEIKEKEVYKDYIPMWNKQDLFKQEDELAKLMLAIENQIPFPSNWVTDSGNDVDFAYTDGD